ncbi:hypothetical protein AB0953_12500 [Streptomyces sp. NPDC046866]|uniref:hypothetical protein n=1 Tax=Streptomyces sp. NPDC046866 TaxID=3154921 RepID=UPI0034556F92
MTVPADLRMIEVSGAEALWLLEGCAQGRLVSVQREVAVVRPAANDTLLRLHPQSVSGFRLARTASGAGR